MMVAKWTGRVEDPICVWEARARATVERTTDGASIFARLSKRNVIHNGLGWPHTPSDIQRASERARGTKHRIDKWEICMETLCRGLWPNSIETQTYISIIQLTIWSVSLSVRANVQSLWGLWRPGTVTMHWELAQGSSSSSSTKWPLSVAALCSIVASRCLFVSIQIARVECPSPWQLSPPGPGVVNCGGRGWHKSESEEPFKGFHMPRPQFSLWCGWTVQLFISSSSSQPRFDGHAKRFPVQTPGGLFLLKLFYFFS